MCQEVGVEVGIIIEEGTIMTMGSTEATEVVAEEVVGIEVDTIMVIVTIMIATEDQIMVKMKCHHQRVKTIIMEADESFLKANQNYC